MTPTPGEVFSPMLALSSGVVKTSGKIPCLKQHLQPANAIAVSPACLFRPIRSEQLCWGSFLKKKNLWGCRENTNAQSIAQRSHSAQCSQCLSRHSPTAARSRRRRGWLWEQGSGPLGRRCRPRAPGALASGQNTGVGHPWAARSWRVPATQRHPLQGGEALAMVQGPAAPGSPAAPGPRCREPRLRAVGLP